MKSKSILLLKTLLLSTSQRNALKYTKDKKKKKKIIGNAIGSVIAYSLIMAFCISICIGYGHYGIIESAPALCAMTISLLAFVFTVFKTNGYLFHFKEYDMLMSLPFSSSTVAGCKFMYMYMKSLPWYLSVSIAVMIGYGYYAKPNFFVYPMWIILSFLIPIIPMLFAAFLGFIIARISAGFRKTNIVQTILTFVFILFCFSLRFILEDIFRNNKVEQTLDTTSKTTDKMAGIYMPAKWFEKAIVDTNVWYFLLFVGVSVALFAIVFYVVGKSYRNINSALKSHATAKKLKKVVQKKRSMVKAIAFKELKRMLDSTPYLVNITVGMVIAVIVSIIMVIFGFETIIGFVTKDAPLTHTMLQPTIPFIVYLFVGMMASTVCSPSLEGKSYWIIQSLPIEKKAVYKGKMLFNICLTVPFITISTLLMCIAAKTPVLDTIIYIILGIALCILSTTWGCVIGMKHLRLDWENEVEVIKQGAGVAIYMIPHWIVIMGMIVLTVVVGTKMNHVVLTAILVVVTALLAFLNYMRVMSLSKKDRI